MYKKALGHTLFWLTRYYAKQALKIGWRQVQFMSYLTTPESLIGHIVGGPCHIILKWAIPVAVFEAPPVPAGQVKFNSSCFCTFWTFYITMQAGLIT